MKNLMTRKILLTALLCGTALTLGPALVRAQSASQTVVVPPGFTAVLVPDFAAGNAQAGLPAMPDPQAMIQQMSAMMTAAEQNAAAMQAQLMGIQNAAESDEMNGAPGGMGQGSAVVITTISDGAHSCTQRIAYPGNGARPNVQLTSAGNGCSIQGMGSDMGGGMSAPAAPVLLPNTTRQAPAAPALIQARTQAPVQAPANAIMVADRD